MRLVLSIGWLDIPAVTLVHRSGLHVLHLRGVVLRHRSVILLGLGLLVVHLRHRLGSSVMLRSVTVSLDRSLVPGSLVVVAATIGSGCVTVPGVLMAFAGVVGVALDTVATVGAVWVGAAGGVRLAVTGRRSVAHRVLRSSMGMVIVLRGAVPVSVTASGRTMILVG